MSVTDLPLSHLRALREVARRGSFTSAARRLFTSQSQLTRLVQDCERLAGVQLLHRGSREVSPTASGRELLQVAEEVLEVHSRALARFEAHLRAERGQLSVSMLPSAAAVLLPEIVRDLHEAHPGIGITALDGPADDVSRHLYEASAEIALTVCDGADDRLLERPLLVEEFVAVAANPAPWGAAETISWQELAEHELVVTRPGTSIRTILDAVLGTSGPYSRAASTATTVATVGGLVRSGLGVSALPAVEIEGYGLHDLVCTTLVDPVVHRSLGLVHLRDLALSPAATAFVRSTTSTLHSMQLPPGVVRL